jgi:hypothetical protein
MSICCLFMYLFWILPYFFRSQLYFQISIFSHFLENLYLKMFEFLEDFLIIIILYYSNAIHSAAQIMIKQNHCSVFLEFILFANQLQPLHSVFVSFFLLNLRKYFIFMIFNYGFLHIFYQQTFISPLLLIL